MSPPAWPLPPSPAGDAVRDALLAAWGAPSRGYHDLLHLSEVLDRLAELGCADRPVLLAAWFHDGVYAGRADDEERSAQWAERALPGLVSPEDVVEVARLVRVTAHHRPDPADLAGALLSDADLAILAAPPGRYADYVAGVRRDFAHVSDGAFATGRAEVLRDLLASAYLFHTDAARSRWEAAARANVSRELAALARR